MIEGKINLSRIVGGFPNQQWLSLGEDPKHAINVAALVRIDRDNVHSGKTDDSMVEILVLHFSNGDRLSLTPKESESFSALMEQAAGKIASMVAQQQARQLGIIG